MLPSGCEESPAVNDADVKKYLWGKDGRKRITERAGRLFFEPGIGAAEQNPCDNCHSLNCVADVGGGGIISE